MGKWISICLKAARALLYLVIATIAADSATLQRHNVRQSRFGKEVMVLVKRLARAGTVGAVRREGFCPSVYAALSGGRHVKANSIHAPQKFMFDVSPVSVPQLFDLQRLQTFKGDEMLFLGCERADAVPCGPITRLLCLSFYSHGSTYLGKPRFGGKEKAVVSHSVAALAL